jgi:hypothetical protein
MLLLELHDEDSRTALCVQVLTVATERCSMDGGEEGALETSALLPKIFDLLSQHRTTVTSQGCDM